MRIFLISLLIVLSSTAFAYDCLPVSDETAFQNARTVFLARITSAELIPEAPQSSVRAKFDVIEVFKGNPASVKFLTSYTSDSPAWEPLMVGEHYIIFAKSESAAFITNCGNNRHFIEAKEAQWLRKHRVTK